MDELLHLQSRTHSPAPGIDLWLGDLDDQSGCGEAVASLSVDEKARAARFHSETDRRRFEAGRGHLRRILGRSLSVPAESIVFRYSETGKPGLDGPDDLGFSVSHSYNLLLIGIGRSPVGVDAELLRPVPDMDAVTRLVFTGKEMDWLNGGAAEETPARFFRLWTAKEALLKGMGIGFLSDPRRVELEPAPFGFRGNPDGKARAGWSVSSFSIASRIAGGTAYGAVAVPGSPPEIRAHPVPGWERRTRARISRSTVHRSEFAPAGRPAASG